MLKVGGCIKNIYRKSYLKFICKSIQEVTQEGGEKVNKLEEQLKWLDELLAK